MTRDQALAKIKKCLALASSANEHEAAAALRQAQALMREHSIEGQDVEILGVVEKATKARTPAATNWDVELATAVAGAFGCEMFSCRHYQFIGGRIRTRRDYVFVGMDTAPTVATYAYDVLARQCTKARLAHVQKQPKTCKPATRTARGDAFALGWVYAVRNLVQQFAGDPEERLLILEYIKTKRPQMGSLKPRDNVSGRNTRDNDLSAGYAAGKSARLNHGLASAAAVPRLG